MSKITSRFKIGQVVWYIEDRSAVSNVITTIYVYDINDPDANVWYSFSNNDFDKREDGALPEEDLYATKEALIKSL